MYGVTEKLVRILNPLVGKSILHMNITQDFTKHIKNITLRTEECITSYDVTTLFTSVPVGSAIDLIKQRSEQDVELEQRTPLTVQHITQHLG